VPDVDNLAVELAALSARLKEIGETGLASELTRQIGQAVEPIPQRIRDRLPPDLPDRYAGVLNDDLDIRRQTSTRDFSTRVSIVATTRSGRRRRLTRLDEGILAHPVYGNRKHWPEQRVTAGWFTQTVEDSAPEVRDAITQALDSVARKAVGE